MNVLPKLQIVSLYKINPERGKLPNIEAKTTPQESLPAIVTQYNQALEESDRYTEVNINPDKWKDVKAQDFQIKWWISIRRHSLSGVSSSLQYLALDNQRQAKDICLGTVSEHHLIFLFRSIKKNKTTLAAQKTEQAWLIFALTTNSANHVIRHFTDFSFPLRLARRICEPVILNEDKIPIGGDYMSQGGEYKREHLIAYSSLESLSQIIKGFTSIVKKTSSLYSEESFKQFFHQKGDKIVVNSLKISIGEMYVRFNHSFTLEEHCQICHQIETILESTIATDLPDESFEYFDHIRRVPKEDKQLIEQLETSMLRKVFQAFSEKKNPTFEFYHHHYEDYNHSNRYVLRIHRKKPIISIKEWGVRPSPEDVLEALRTYFKPKNLVEFITGLKSLMFDFYFLKKKNPSTYALQEFFKGEVFHQGKQYFYLDGNWCEVEGEYYSYVQNEFRKKMKEVFLSQSEAGALPLAWVSKKEWASVSFKDLMKLAPDEKQWEAIQKELLAAQFYLAKSKSTPSPVLVFSQAFLSRPFIDLIPLEESQKEKFRTALEKLWKPGTELTTHPLQTMEIDHNDWLSFIKWISKPVPFFVKKANNSSDYFILSDPETLPEGLKEKLGEKCLEYLKIRYVWFTNYCKKEENYNRKYLFDNMNKGNFFDSNQGYLVFDQIYPSQQQKIELFDIAYYSPDGLWLYYVKEQVGQKTRDACSQLRTAAEALSKALMIGVKSDVLSLIFDRAVQDSPKSDFQKKVKQQLESFGENSEQQKIQFLNIFRKKNSKDIAFVYAFLDDATEERDLKAELYCSYPFNSNEFGPECTSYEGKLPLTGHAILEALKKEGFIDHNYRLSDQFISLNKPEEFKPDFLKSVKKAGYRKKNRDAIFKALQSHLSQYNSFIAKKELLDTKRYIEGLGFSFRICQIYRDGKPADLVHFHEVESQPQKDDGIQNWNDVFDFEKQVYLIRKTAGGGACALHALNGIEHNGQIIFCHDQTDPHCAAKQNFISQLQTALKAKNEEIKKDLVILFTNFLKEYWDKNTWNEPKILYDSIDLSLTTAQTERSEKINKKKAFAEQRTFAFFTYFKNQEDPAWRDKYLNVLKDYNSKWRKLKDEELYKEIRLNPQAVIDGCWDSLYAIMGQKEKEKLDPIQKEIDELKTELNDWESTFITKNFEVVWEKYRKSILKSNYFLSQKEIELASIVYKKKNVRIVSQSGNQPLVLSALYNPDEGKDSTLIYHSRDHYSHCTYLQTMP